ncbi:MAG: hypothetical protein FJ249_11825, partial [Nitrospira sp.]|nr:hypothetical protein [Nitrospira sp.]
RWVKKKAARLLHLNARSFRYRLEKYAIKGGQDDEDVKPESGTVKGEA